MNDTYTFYFGAAQPENAKAALDYFQDDQGNYFYNKVVVDEEMFAIYDTCNRMMPIDREFVQNFGTAMFRVASVYRAADEAGQLFNRRINETNKLVAFWNEQERE